MQPPKFIEHLYDNDNSKMLFSTEFSEEKAGMGIDNYKNVALSAFKDLLKRNDSENEINSIDVDVDKADTIIIKLTLYLKNEKPSQDKIRAAVKMVELQNT